MAIFQTLHTRGITMILVTHDPDIARHAERIVSVKDGYIVSDIMVGRRLDAKAILESMPTQNRSDSGDSAASQATAQ
jgi:putative ABC transport system ATP-binding protein